MTDNASNNMAAAKLLKNNRPQIFWTSCAAHSMNLMLESIANLPRFKKTIDQAKALTIFIYAHHKTLSMMRSHTKKRDIVRPGVTRFASSFLSLQSIYEKRSQLRVMFTSIEWEQCKFSKTPKGKAAYTTILSMGFWNGVSSCLEIFEPLVRVLRLADGDKKPSMGFVYGELMRAKEEVKSTLSNIVKNYQPIINIIDAKMKDRLDSPLHLTAYLLNPFYHYKDPLLHLDHDVAVGVIDCLDVLFPGNLVIQNQIMNDELPKYKNKENLFGREVAVAACTKEKYIEKFDPGNSILKSPKLKKSKFNDFYSFILLLFLCVVNWWSNYGSITPNLQRLAMRILSLTTSSSGCERNWSAFEGVSKLSLW